jgi:MraZ protein
MDGLVVTKGFENCLFVFSKTEWQDFANQLKQLKTLKKNSRLLSRFIFGGANEDQPDKAGRIIVPSTLRTWAALKKEVVIIGVGNRLEVWSKENWQKTEKQAAGSFSDIAEELSDLGF